MVSGGLGEVPLEDLAEVLQGGAGGQGAGPKALPAAPSSLPQPEPLQLLMLLLLLLPLLLPLLPLGQPLLRHVLYLELLDSPLVHLASPASSSSLPSLLGKWGSTLPSVSSLLEVGQGRV